MVFNQGKIKAANFRPKSANKTKCKFKFGCLEIEVGNKYTYFRLYFNEHVVD